jgi:hypothetical protein
VVLAGAVALVVPTPARLVERWYSQGLYPWVQRCLTSATNLVPVAALDLALGAGFVWLVLGGVRLATAQKGGRWPLALAASWRAVCLAAGLYLAFLAAWGLNYRRLPLVHGLDFQAARASAASLEDLARATVIDLNGLWSASRLPSPSPAPEREQLASAFDRVQRAVGLPGRATPGRPKWSVLDLYCTRAGVSGMTDPFFLETLVASDVLPFERPSVVAHEWGHLAGLARESEASFFGWLVCLAAGPAERYSGQLEMLLRVVGPLGAASRQSVLASLRHEVREDISLIAERNRRSRWPVLSRGAWGLYDGFLRANRVASGVSSYGEVVTLVLGTRFGADGMPIRRMVPP